MKIISGGQTGVDRAALDEVLELGIPCGGKCPKGRMAEDGAIPARYPLDEMRVSDYDARTRANVMESDGTLILNRGIILSGGTALTAQLAREASKPLLIVDLNQPLNTMSFVTWLTGEHITILNVAGPRESSQPGIHDQAKRLLTEYMRAVLSARSNKAI